MDRKLLPKHYGFAIMFIKLRWVAIILLFLSAYFVKNIADIDIQDNPIYVVSLILLIANFGYFLHLKTRWLMDFQFLLSGIRKLLQ